MFDDDMNTISDEMFAAYIDGNSTPIENILVTDFLSNESALEILDLSEDCKNGELLASIEPLVISDIVDDFVRPFKDYDELKGSIDNPDSSLIM